MLSLIVYHIGVVPQVSSCPIVPVASLLQEKAQHGFKMGFKVYILSHKLEERGCVANDAIDPGQD